MRHFVRHSVGIAAALLLLVNLPAYADSDQTPPPAPPGDIETETITLEGHVTAVRALRGRAPQLTDSSGKSWLVEGELQDEILRASGTRVRLSGQSGEPILMMPTIIAMNYQILEIDGKPPFVGTLISDSERRLLLDTKNRFLIIDAPEVLRKELTRRVGCKVWIVGDLTDRNLTAYKYGWLKCQRSRLRK